MKTTKLFIAAAMLLSAVALRAEIKLPSVISDNMVLQQQTSAALWGTATPGSKVTLVTGWDAKKTVLTADSQSGKWFTRVNTPVAGGPYEISISDGEKVVLKNVLIGEVWYASGQSNMDMPVKGYRSQPAENGVDYISAAKASRQIRMCTIQKSSSLTPLDETVGSWGEHTPENVGNTSATAYFFAEYLQKALDVPVGIIVTAWGGSSIETWINRETFEKEFPSVSLAHLDGKVPVKRPNTDPCLLFNGQVNALIPFTFKGMIWYQGCHNRMAPDDYVKFQEAYARMMRGLFEVPDAPFYFVQIAPYSYGKPESWDNGYFNEAQAKTLSIIPHSGMAVTCDVGEYGTIHPCRKQQVGKRLALLALHDDYGMNTIEARGPFYKDVKFEKDKAYVTFTVGELGISPMGPQISGFEIAGADKVFHKADAKFKDYQTVVVSCPEVPEPVAVRYCFRNWCEGGLYNNFGVPAAPFRTDDWGKGDVAL